MKITKIFRESVPGSRLIGKRYTDSDSQNGSFGHKWGEFWQNDWFGALERAGGRQDFDYIGMMRFVNGKFEYWIGMLFAPGAAVPDGFEYADVASYDAAVCYIYGQGGELFGSEVHNACLALIEERGWTWREGDWCIERYNCPRYTTPDELGNVIVDYYIAVE